MANTKFKYIIIIIFIVIVIVIVIIVPVRIPYTTTFNFRAHLPISQSFTWPDTKLRHDTRGKLWKKYESVLYAWCYIGANSDWMKIKQFCYYFRQMDNGETER